MRRSCSPSACNTLARNARLLRNVGTMRIVAISLILFGLTASFGPIARACDGVWCECKTNECLNRWAPVVEKQRERMREDAIHRAHLDKVWRIVKTCDDARKCTVGIRGMTGAFRSEAECRETLRVHPPIWRWPGRSDCDFGLPPLN